MRFDKYEISDEIKTNLEKLDFKKPTDIQYKTIPNILNGEDVLAIAQTGTGKTAAFAIPLIDKIHRAKTSKRAVGIKCIIMVPTRELALQIGEVFAKISKYTRVKTFSLYGGVEQDAQIKKLQDGIDVLIATPGRMFDLINQGFIRIENINTLVLDEADHMLKLGFIEDIKYVKKMLKKRHQTLFFSATIDEEIKKLAYSQVKSSAVRIQISPKDPVSKNVSHFVMSVEMDDKRFFLERFIKDNAEAKMIVFVRTKVRAERVLKAMERVGIDAETIHSDKEQDDRTTVMRKFRNGECNILIATDITARGIDIPDVQYVINYDLPEVTENYVHRVGRTGRGFNKGVAISFCSTEEKELLEEIHTFINKDIEVIKVTQKEYAFTVDPNKEKTEEYDIDALIAEDDLWQSKKKKDKGKKNRPKNRKQLGKLKKRK